MAGVVVVVRNVKKSLSRNQPIEVDIKLSVYTQNHLHDGLSILNKRMAIYRVLLNPFIDALSRSTTDAIM